MFWDSDSIQLYTCDTLFDVIPESGPQNMAHPLFLGSSDIVPWDPSHQTQPEEDDNNGGSSSSGSKSTDAYKIILELHYVSSPIID